MSEQPIRVAIVGAGIIGHNHAAAMLRLPRLRVDAVVDPIPAASQALADRLGSPFCYATLDSALSEVDLVAICTPSGLHADAAEQALAAGKHVVIEKPLDVSLARARHIAELASLAQERGQVCSVISQHRFDPASVAVAQAVNDGRLGRLTSAVASVPWWREQSYYDSAVWRGTPDLDGGVTMNQAIHTIDLLVWLLGQPEEVYARTATLAHHSIEVEDVAVATIGFQSGALAVLHASTAAYPGLPVRLSIHGTQGSAVINGDQLEFLGASPVAATDPLPDSFVDGHLRQYEDIVAAIDSGGPPAITARDSLTTLAVVHAVYRSAMLGAPVKVEAA